jgi:molybdopterin-guanine dinucleotide biosynthesis protein A
MLPAGPPPLTGLVLAGGASRRMGRDKAVLEFDGVPLVERVAARLEQVCGEVLVASGDGRRLGGLRWEQIPDAVEAGGPLAGIVAGLRRAVTPLLAVVAVDMPDAAPEVLARLAADWAGEAAVVPVVEGRLQPLHGVYAAGAAPRLAAALSSGERSVSRAVSLVGARAVGPEVWGAVAPSGRFARNLNRPEDLETG